jgi:RNA polymerase sigma-70 factor, ECF subfamily
MTMHMTEFEFFYRDNLRLVHAAAITHVNGAEEAADIVQEVFLRAWRCFPLVSSLPVPARRAWLLTSVRNCAIDGWRRAGREETLQGEPRGREPPPPELRLDVAGAVSRLPAVDQDIVLMRYVQGMTSREIGESLGMPEGTVRRRLAGCRARLAPLLDGWTQGGGAR